MILKNNNTLINKGLIKRKKKERRAINPDRRAIISDSDEQLSENKMKKNPPENPIQSRQMDLFCNSFVTNEIDNVSNAIEIWESIPKYFFTPAQVNKLRTLDGLAKPYEQQYIHKGIDCTVTIQPALIKQENGSYKAFFPSVTEELIEETLKKILADQNFGIHDSDKSETWVKFSLYMLQKELKKRGKTRSIVEIKHSIQVMSRSNLTLSKGKKELWNGSILQDLVTVDREEYIEGSGDLHIARLPLFISHAIDKLEYRQFNVDRLMSLNTQLARWLYKRFVHRYKQASLTEKYHFMYTTVQKESRYLEGNVERNNRKKMIIALDQLKEQGVLMSYETQEAREGRKIIDVKYTVTSSLDFRKEQKAANLAQKNRKLRFIK